MESTKNKEEDILLKRDPVSWGVMVLRCFLLLSTVPHVVRGQDLGPSYKTTERYCSNNSQCDTSSGEVCWWAYDGCKKGKCRCHPNTHFQDASGICRHFILGGDSCSPTDKCLDGMSCIRGSCQCIEGRLTNDRKYCLRVHEKLLGEACDPSHDRCYQLNSATGLTYSEVRCTQNVCRCITGLKQDNGRCRRSNVLEDCSADYHCQGGALCIYNKCQCPVNFIPVAGNTKCARIGAATDLGLMESCDEFHRKSYCGSGLICHRCDDQSDSICVRFLEALQGKLVGSSAKLHGHSVISVMITFIWIISFINRIFS